MDKKEMMELVSMMEAMIDRKLEQTVGKLEQRFDNLEQSVKNLEQSVKNLEQRLGNLEQSVKKLEERLGNLEQRVEKLEQSVEKLEQRVAKLEQSVGKLEQSVEKLEQSVAKLEQSVAKLESANEMEILPALRGLADGILENRELLQKLDKLDKMDMKIDVFCAAVYTEIISETAAHMEYIANAVKQHYPENPDFQYDKVLKDTYKWVKSKYPDAEEEDLFRIAQDVADIINRK